MKKMMFIAAIAMCAMACGNCKKCDKQCEKQCEEAAVEVVEEAVADSAVVVEAEAVAE